MLRKFTAVLICLMMLVALPISAWADTGPKPSIQIAFTGAPEGGYYGTLLSKDPSTGPASVWDGDPRNADYQPGEEGYDIWQKFAQYKDQDGYYFLQWFWECSEKHQLNWRYYPPSPFKILLYFPETDSFYVSEVYERYAFDSYFTVDLTDLSAVTVEKSYDHAGEIVSLWARIILTILLELGVALFFGYREKKVLKFLAGINIITQLALNIALSLFNYNNGPRLFSMRYVAFELAVLAVEAVLYGVLFPKLSQAPQSKGKAVLYAAVANTLSFGLGLWLSHLIPEIF